MAQPEMRAGQMKADLAGIDELSNAAAIRATLRPETLKAITEARTAAWLPIELDVELNKAVFEALGEDRMKAWSRKAMVRSFEGPLLHHLVDGAAKLFGLSPASWMKWLPRIWPAMVRNAGLLEVAESAPTSCTLAYRDIPDTALDRAFLIGLCGACEAALALGKADGRVEYREDKALKTVFFAATWKTKGP